MTTSRRHTAGARPVIVEIVPDNVSKSKRRSISPLSTSSKGVQFAEPTEYSRPLTPTEAWSLYHFEHHARHCPHCRDPYAVYKRRGSLCDIGRGLAHDTTLHVYYHDEDIFSTTRDGGKPIRVEVPHRYDHIRGLLKAITRGFRIQTATPVISYDRSYPASRRTAYLDDERYPRETVIIEPARSSDRRSHHRHSKHKSTRYPKVVIDNDDDDDVADSSGWTPAQLRRGTFYEEDMRRKRDKYRVEYRQPLSLDPREKRMSFYL